MFFQNSPFGHFNLEGINFLKITLKIEGGYNRCLALVFTAVNVPQSL